MISAHNSLGRLSNKPGIVWFDAEDRRGRSKTLLILYDFSRYCIISPCLIDGDDRVCGSQVNTDNDFSLLLWTGFNHDFPLNYFWLKAEGSSPREILIYSNKFNLLT